MPQTVTRKVQTRNGVKEVRLIVRDPKDKPPRPTPPAPAPHDDEDAE